MLESVDNEHKAIIELLELAFSGGCETWHAGSRGESLFHVKGWRPPLLERNVNMTKDLDN